MRYQIQYSTKQAYRNRRNQHDSIFGKRVAFLHSFYRCTGIKMCEFTDPELKQMVHSHVTEDIWQRIKELRQHIAFSDTQNPLQPATYRLYQSTMRSFKINRISCRSWKDTCSPRGQWVEDVSNIFLLSF